MVYKRLGDYIREVNVRNRDLKVTNLLGLSVSKEFMPSIANTIGTDMSTYKVVERAGKKIGIFSVMKEQSISSDDVSLESAVDTAKDIVSSLNEEGCDYVIAIAHGGDAFAHEIAKSVEGINTVIASCDVVEKWKVFGI